MATNKNKWIEEQEFIYLAKFRELQARIRWSNQRTNLNIYELDKSKRRRVLQFFKG